MNSTIGRGIALFSDIRGTRILRHPAQTMVRDFTHDLALEGDGMWGRLPAKLVAYSLPELPETWKLWLAKPILFADQMRRVTLILHAVVVDEFRIDSDVLRQSNGPRRGVGLSIIHCERYFQASKIGAADAFRNLSGACHRAAVAIKPHIIAKAIRDDHQRVAFPMTRGIAQGQRLRIFRQLATV